MPQKKWDTTNKKLLYNIDDDGGDDDDDIGDVNDDVYVYFCHNCHKRQQNKTFVCKWSVLWQRLVAVVACVVVYFLSA